MNDLNDILKILKIDLMISTAAYDEMLLALIQAAMGYIETEGISLDFANITDAYLVKDYAAWLYRQRREVSGPGMPRSLRWALNNRLFSQKSRP